MKIKSLVCVILMIVGLSVAAFAQTELPMIKSSGEFRARALANITDIDSVLFPESGGRSSYGYKTWSGRKSSTDVLAEASGVSVSYETFDTSEMMYFYVSLNSKSGNGLFYGYNKAKPEEVNGDWKLPDSIRNVELEMNSTQPITMEKQVSYAQLFYKDAYGNSRQDELYVNGKDVWFSVNSAGLENAYMKVTYTDGSSSAYSTSTGAFMPSVILSTSASGKFKDLFTFKNPTSTMVVSVKSDRGHGVVPTIEVVNDGASQSFLFDVTTTDGKRPVKYWVSQDGVKGDTLTPTAGSTTFGILIPTGISYVVPDWNPTDFTEDPQPVATGGGKG